MKRLGGYNFTLDGSETSQRSRNIKFDILTLAKDIMHSFGMQTHFARFLPSSCCHLFEDGNYNCSLQPAAKILK